MGERKIPTILGILILTAGIAASLALIKNRKTIKLSAQGDIRPKDTRTSNITDVSFTVSWITDKKTYGFVKWGTSNLNRTALGTQDEPGFVHWITIEELSPSTSYFFKINSEGTEFDNNGIPWEIKTGPTIAKGSESNVISGKLAANKTHAIIYVTVGGSSLLSTITFEDENWLIPISNARTQTLSSYIDIDEKNTLLEIFVQAPPEGYTSAQVYPEAAKPIPPMTLGENYNFRNIEGNNKVEIPEASIRLPEDSTKSSRFNVP
jgi:hypothetical protein